METSGLVRATYVDTFVDDFESGDFGREGLESSLLSPDTNEFLALEQQVFAEEQRDEFRSPDVQNQGPSIIVRTASYTERRSPSSLEQEQLLQMEQQKQQLQSELESKLEERKRSIDAAEHLVMDEDGQLQMLERRPFRSFSRADEYLYAMKEDLAEWLNILYVSVDIDADNFMSKLETGELLVKVRTINFDYSRPLKLPQVVALRVT